MAHVEEINNQAKIDRELRDVISTLTHHLTSIGGGGGGGDRGLGIVTLAGSNKGAVMKGDVLDEGTEHGRGADGEPRLSAYTNSNYQSVNNSIMIDGKVEAEDPGVHIEIIDSVEEEDEEKSGGDDEHEKKKKKEKKKEKKEKKGKKEKKEEESSHDQKGKDEKGSESE